MLGLNALCENNMHDNKIVSQIPKDLQGVDIGVTGRLDLSFNKTKPPNCSTK